MTAARVALVTGTNQGIGLALVEGLAARMGSDDLVLLTGRNAQRVADAASLIAKAPGTRSRVEGRVLDVAGAVARLAAELDERHGGVDIVVSNAVARIVPDRPQSEQADEFIDVVNGGTYAILRSFAPVLRPGGRLIVVACHSRRDGRGTGLAAQAQRAIQGGPGRCGASGRGAAPSERRARGHPGRGGLPRARGHPAVAAVVRRLQPGADASVGRADRARPGAVRTGRPQDLR